MQATLTGGIPDCVKYGRPLAAKPCGILDDACTLIQISSDDGDVYLRFGNVQQVKDVIGQLNSMCAEYDARQQQAATLAELDKQFAELPVEKPAEEEPQVFQQGENWTCECGYMTNGPICTHCGLRSFVAEFVETPASTRG